MMDNQERFSQKKNHFIRGIYNYCDRWCERCRFTDQCMNYSLEMENLWHPDAEDDIDNLITQHLSDALEMAMEVFEDICEDQTDDDQEMPEDWNLEPSSAPNGLAPVVHLLVVRAESYAASMEQWLNENILELEYAMQSEDFHLFLTLLPKKSRPSQAPMEECIEIITWYQYQISVMLHRAIQSKYSVIETECQLRESDGLAKVALIGIDRSINAWQQLATYLPEEQSQLKSLIRMLESLKRATEMEFPNAWDFIRPGFDE